MLSLVARLATRTLHNSHYSRSSATFHLGPLAGLSRAGSSPLTFSAPQFLPLTYSNRTPKDFFLLRWRQAYGSELFAADPNKNPLSPYAYQAETQRVFLG